MQTNKLFEMNSGVDKGPSGNDLGSMGLPIAHFSFPPGIHNQKSSIIAIWTENTSYIFISSSKGKYLKYIYHKDPKWQGLQWSILKLIQKLILKHHIC